MADRFRWHPAAVLVDANGARHRASDGPPLPRQSPALPRTIADRPASLALQTAIATPTFRIDADPTAPPPDPWTEPLFETLTGGTSGQPRRIRRSHASWIASFTVNAGLFHMGPGTRVGLLGRLIHSLSLYAALEGLHLGADVHLLDTLRPDRQRAALAARAIDLLYATPAQMRLLVDASGPSLPDLRLILIGGAKLDPALRADLATLCPNAALHEFYGASETSFITLSDATTPPDSVGRPYPGVEIALRDTSDAADPAEIWVRSPYLALGYADADTSGAEWRDGWVCVGERGQMTKGALYLAGRAGRMITIADQNVFPEQIEAFLLAQPGIRRAAVLPLPDGLRGHILIAVAQGDPTQETACLAALRARFGPLKSPRKILWRDDWPMLPSGKTDLRALGAAL